MTILLHEFREATRRNQVSEQPSLPVQKRESLRSPSSFVLSYAIFDRILVCEIGPLRDAILQLKKMSDKQIYTNSPTLLTFSSCETSLTMADGHPFLIVAP